MKVDNNTYFISDPHYGHKNIVAGESSWFYDEELTEEEIMAIRRKHCRNFNTLEEMNRTIVNNINEKVPENATLICLGDWSFGSIENIWNFRKQINCKDIHLILGNHDYHIAKNHYIIIPKEDEDLLGKYDILWHWEYKNEKSNKAVYAQDLFTSVSNYKEIQFKKNGYRHDIILSHYAMRVWNKSHHGSIMLYGHSHGTLDEMRPNIANPTWIGDKYYIRNFRTMDVGLDTNNFYPYHINKIVNIMKDRPIGMEIDHH